MTTEGKKPRHQPNKAEITAARLQLIKALAGRKRKFNATTLQKHGAINNLTTQTALEWIHMLVKAGICKRLNHRNWIMVPASRDQQIAQMSKALGVGEFTSPSETPAEIRRRLLASQRIDEKFEANKKKAGISAMKSIAESNSETKRIVHRYKLLEAAVGIKMINDIIGE